MLEPGSDAAGLVGSVLAGRYRILSLLGEGAMGAVYLGEHLKIGRRDAIKVLRPSMARDEEAIARFTRGARHASEIRHPNVCAIYDFGTTEQGLHFLAMEFVEGGALSELLAAEGRIPVVRAVDLLRQAADALQVAHDRGIIHRDLKPDNIMLSREADGSERVKVVDFDIALGTREGEGARVTRHGYVVGTPEYMSPEQLTGDPLDARSDVYSLALVFFRMLTGRLPFDPGTAQDVMVRRLTVDPLPLRTAAPDAGIPEALEPVLGKALARRAADRHSSAAEFAEAVEGAVGGRAPAGAPARGGAGAGAGGAPSGPGPGDRGAIPPTRVSSAAAEEAAPGAGSSDPAGHAWRPSRSAVVAGGAAALLVGAVGAALLVTSAGDDDPGTGALPLEDLVPGAPAGRDRPGTVEAEADPAPDPGAAAAPEREPPPEPSPGAARGPAEVPSPDPAEPTAPELQLPEEAAAEVLIRQLLARDEAGGEERPALEATRDTTLALWSAGAMNRADSALASYILGSVLISLGDSIRGVEWLEEAVRLDPQRGYLELLELHRGEVR